ncbi:MAG: D-alanine--D-alanine ligase [Sphaerochaetaceae bacterium]
MGDKGTIALLYGGKSTEHAVSCRSAANVGYQLDCGGFNVIPIGIDYQGRWTLKEVDFKTKPPILDSDYDENNEITIKMGLGFFHKDKRLPITSCFPLTHGNNGEDGKIQGVIKLANLPLIGSGVKASALAMNKESTKRILYKKNVSTLASYLVYKNKSHEIKRLFYEIRAALGQNVFVKPVNGGSSVGVTAIKDLNINSLTEALQNVWAYSPCALIEPLLSNFIELECAVLEVGGSLIASFPGQVIDPLEKENAFLTYEQKYLGQNCAYIEAPANLQIGLLNGIQKLALLISKEIGISGFSRVDFFYDLDKKRVYFNEINTIPGMSMSSHYPVLAASMGYEWPLLLETLVATSLREFEEKKEISYQGFK